MPGTAWAFLASVSMSAQTNIGSPPLSGDSHGRSPTNPGFKTVLPSGSCGSARYPSAQVAAVTALPWLLIVLQVTPRISKFGYDEADCTAPLCRVSNVNKITSFFGAGASAGTCRARPAARDQKRGGAGERSDSAAASAKRVASGEPKAARKRRGTLDGFLVRSSPAASARASAPSPKEAKQGEQSAHCESDAEMARRLQAEVRSHACAHVRTPWPRLCVSQSFSVFGYPPEH